MEPTLQEQSVKFKSEAAQLDRYASYLEQKKHEKSMDEVMELEHLLNIGKAIALHITIKL